MGHTLSVLGMLALISTTILYLYESSIGCTGAGESLLLEVVLFLLEHLVDNLSVGAGGSLDVVEDDGSVIESVSTCMSCVD